MSVEKQTWLVDRWPPTNLCIRSLYEVYSKTLGEAINIKVLKLQKRHIVERLIWRLLGYDAAENCWIFHPLWYRYARSKGKRVIAFIDDPTSQLDENALRLERTIIPRCDVVVTTTRQLADYLQNNVGIPPEKIKVIPAPVDTEHFRPLKTSSDRKGEEIRVGFPTMKLNMERLSGVLHFLESLDAKFKLLLAYPPPPAIIPIYANNVDIVYVGYYSYEDLPRFYSLCDLVVNYLPEKIAGRQSVKELQAMACGVPVISPSLHRDYVEMLVKDAEFRKAEGPRLRAKIVEKNSYQSVASELLRLGLV
ncbi:MAG: glycosyltransferase family 4 protein [Nitrososphaerota archaeon]